MVELATPWVLAGIPIPFFIHWFFKDAKISARNGLVIPHYHLVSTLENKKNLHASSFSWWLLLSWILIIFAASGPRWIGEPIALTQPGHNIMLALDISGSMAMNDMQWNHRRATRLYVVKQAAMQFVQERQGDKLGLILFGTRAYIQTPLTHDKHTVLTRLEDASVGLAGNSTSLGDPIGLAVKHLQHTPASGRVIILLTDGANNSGVLSLDKATQLAHDNDIKIYTIGLGAEIPNRLGNGLFYPANSSMDLDEEALKKISTGTNGRYFRATDQTSLQEIYALINQMETIPQEQLPIRPQRDYYMWPLGLAFCMLFAGLIYELNGRRGLTS